MYIYNSINNYLSIHIINYSIIIIISKYINSSIISIHIINNSRVYISIHMGIHIV